MQVLSLNELKPHQTQAINKWLEKKTGTIEAATGIGKTRIAIEIMNHYKKILIVVPQLSLYDNWKEEIKKWSNKKYNIDFMCYISIGKVDNFKDYDLIIFDEIHHLGSETHLPKFELLKNNNIHKLGLTATMPYNYDYQGDLFKDNKYHFINNLCPVIFKLNLNNATEIGAVSNFEVVIIKTEMDKENKDILSGNKNNRFYSTEYEAYQYLNNKISELSKRRLTYDSNKSLDKLYMGLIQKRMHLIYNMKDKVNAGRYILNHPSFNDKRTIAFTSNIDNCEKICEYTYHSKRNDNDFVLFQNKDIDKLAVVNCINEGININDLDRIIITQVNSQERNLIQRIGRVIRLRHNHVGKVIITITKETKDEEWLRKILYNIKSKISYFEYKKINGKSSIKEIKCN